MEGFVANLSVQRQFFPTDEDESGAARALMRLQDTYKLDPDTISRGELPGNAPPFAYVLSVPLTVGVGADLLGFYSVSVSHASTPTPMS